MNDLFQKTPAESAITVSQLNRRAKTLLEQGLAKLWVEGELSNLARPASGHVYFSLKDNGAQIRGAFFRQRQRGPTIGFKNGDLVLVFGRVSLYEPRGDYQLIVEQIEPAGEGALKREFDRLKQKLADEGLFDDGNKQPLPVLPARIGVITSPSGAAIKDILSVLARRFPAIPVAIYPAAVQGDAAPGELIRALKTANARAECDVLIIGRGGGSLEDLWAFNDEALARSIAGSEIPIVSAVGHEVDFTIADFAADLRAPTPSGAAEMIVPDAMEWLRSFEAFDLRLGRLGQRLLEEREQTLDWLQRRLLQQSPRATLERQAKTLSDLRARLVAAVRSDILGRHSRLRGIQSELFRQSPALRIERNRSRMNHAEDLLKTRMARLVESRQHRLSLGARSLDAVSPLATLGRGYAIVSRAESGKVVRKASELGEGDLIHARLAEGRVSATVTDTDDS
ncbi:MAG: exodeoxyribonuclease VII large subunit [Pseudomonadota bacterium]